jgi:methylated-DNA-[protein]-cysteine S-methyltransferase
MRYTRIESPVGDLLLIGERGAKGLALCGLYFVGAAHARRAIPAGAAPDPAAFGDVAAQLREYFDGARTEFELELDVRGGTELQRAVWRALTAIPYGETRTYAAIARSIGRPHAVRAVGAANARNPISIVVPCHRVVGADGALTGYAGGLANKRRLLEVEAR